MQVRLPKPLHGWRAFVGEVGVIVLGVVIALAGGQLVDNWRRKNDANDAERAVVRELAQNAGVFDERTMLAPCLSKQLAQISRVLSNAQRTGRTGVVSGVQGPNLRPVANAAWEAAIADGTVSQFPSEHRQSYATIYPVISDYARQVDEENRLWTHLYLLLNRHGTISDSMITEITNYSAEAGYRTWLVNTAAEQQLAAIRGLGIDPQYRPIVLNGPGGRSEVLRLAQSIGEAPPNCRIVTVDGKPVSIKAPD